MDIIFQVWTIVSHLLINILWEARVCKKKCQPAFETQDYCLALSSDREECCGKCTGLDGKDVENLTSQLLPEKS